MTKAQPAESKVLRRSRSAGPQSGKHAHGATGGLTFDAFQELIYHRYYKTDNARGAAGTFVLLMEEVGELATALHDNREPRSKLHRMGKKRPISNDERNNLVEEFADVLAWLATLANIHNVRLADALKKYTDGGIEGVKD
jgi:NTP pyrophosphatase (non-canonical NTP hydrolase)